MCRIKVRTYGYSIGKNNVQKEPEIAASGAKTHRKRNLVIVTLLFLIAAAGVALAYFLFWQHEEETEDAYVAGHLVMITPQVNGTVRKVMYDDTDVVKKAMFWWLWTTAIFSWHTIARKMN